MNEHENEDFEYTLAQVLELSSIEREYVARDTKSLELLEALASDWRADVRVAVAGNPYVTPEILEVLLDDRRNYVRAEAQRSLNLTKQQLNVLSRSHDPECRENVASHPNVSAVVLERLADDPDVYVKWAVIGNSKTPEEVSDRLLQERNQWLLEE